MQEGNTEGDPLLRQKWEMGEVWNSTKCGLRRIRKKPIRWNGNIPKSNVDQYY